MSTRISSALLVMLVACGEARPDAPAGGEPTAIARGGEQAAAAGAARLPCALANTGAFTPSCTVDRVERDAGVVLTLRHPDGGFRRLLVTEDGRGVWAADGAEPAQVALVGKNVIEVSVAGDRYRLPARISGGAQ